MKKNANKLTFRFLYRASFVRAVQRQVICSNKFLKLIFNSTGKCRIYTSGITLTGLVVMLQHLTERFKSLGTTVAVTARKEGTLVLKVTRIRVVDPE
jgi:hypothetical protein